MYSLLRELAKRDIEGQLDKKCMKIIQAKLQSHGKANNVRPKVRPKSKLR